MCGVSWAAAIVLSVNILVFPVTSEKELRRTLVLSLEHIATFSHLLAKVSPSADLSFSHHGYLRNVFSCLITPADTMDDLS